MDDSPSEDSEPTVTSTAFVADSIATDPSLLASLTEHFYRAEVDRVTTWRTRLDQTTNWAVVVMAAILTWAFTSPDNPHYVLLIGMLAVIVFLFVEAQRYQEYDAWRFRVRLLQEEFFAPAYDRSPDENVDWGERLSEELREPTVHIPISTAVAHRLQRTYLPLLTVLMVAWLSRITVFEPEPWGETAAIAGVPGPVVAGIVTLIYLVLAGLALWSVRKSTKREFDDDRSIVNEDRGR